MVLLIRIMVSCSESMTRSTSAKLVGIRCDAHLNVAVLPIQTRMFMEIEVEPKNSLELPNNGVRRARGEVDVLDLGRKSAIVVNMSYCDATRDVNLSDPRILPQSLMHPPVYPCRDFENTWRSILGAQPAVNQCGVPKSACLPSPMVADIGLKIKTCDLT
jgi:hypothetical protein